MDKNDYIAALSDYSHLATPVKVKSRLAQLLCKHDFECISWAWFRCVKCGKEEGL